MSTLQTVKCSLTHVQSLLFNYRDHPCCVPLAWWHGVPQGAWTGPRSLREGWLPPSIPPDICPALWNHNTHLTHFLCYVMSALPPGFTLFASVTLAAASINTRLDLPAQLQLPQEIAGIVARPWRLPLSGIGWEYTQQPTMAPFQDVPCTIKLCTAQ